MIVSWNWLKQYVPLEMSVEALIERLMMAGLNYDDKKGPDKNGIWEVDGDLAFDLEVTSNRPDCLGHLGVAREVGVLFGLPVRIPAAAPPVVAARADEATAVEIQCPDLCPRYSARLIRGVKIGPSPAWMRQRLKTAGVNPINNVVDCTNYVLLECSQPLHTFDFDKLQGGRIVVRRAAAGEKIVAINHATFELTPDMCVIADASRAAAVAGVMGGFDTEIHDGTTNVLLEAAEFAPRTVRATARRLDLHSPSSYRFERGVDAHQLDWASRRCAELILETAGGELLDGAVVAQSADLPRREPITLRFPQIRRLLGIDIPRDEVVRILLALGLVEHGRATPESVTLMPPSWRRDLTREIDLIEEAARIHGYEAIPENVPVPLALSAQTVRDKVQDRVAGVLVGCGFFEAYTLTFVNEELALQFRPWGDQPLLRVEHSSRVDENVLRQSLVPRLLACRQFNERHGNFDARLFEIARAYLSAEPGAPQAELLLLGLVSEQSFSEVKGILTAVAQACRRSSIVTTRPTDRPEFAPGRGAEVWLDGERWGWLGELHADLRDQLGLKTPVVVAECLTSRLEALLDTAPKSREVPKFPGMERDLNLVLDENITWQELSELVAQTAGPLLESLTFGGQYRGQQVAADKKSYLLNLVYRNPSRTLTTDEVDAAQQAVLQACQTRLGAALR